jgi:uncharacterized protein with HEPN domain
MQPEQKDAALLWDIKKAAEDILEFVKGMKDHQFKSNKVVRYAVERQILVIGEAAKNVSDSLKENHPEIPWSAIIGQRNIIAHEYSDILVELTCPCFWSSRYESISRLDLHPIPGPIFMRI